MNDMTVAVRKDPLARGCFKDWHFTSKDKAFIMENCVRLLMTNQYAGPADDLLQALRSHYKVAALSHPWCNATRIWWIGNIGTVRADSPYDRFAADWTPPHPRGSLEHNLEPIEQINVKWLRPVVAAHHYSMHMDFGAVKHYRGKGTAQRRFEGRIDRANKNPNSEYARRTMAEYPHCFN